MSIRPGQGVSSRRIRPRPQKRKNKWSAQRRQKPIWRVSIKVSSEAEEAVSDLLSEILGQSVSSYTDVETGLVTVAAFLSSKRIWSAGTAEQVHRRLHFISSCGLSLGPAEVSFKKVEPRDWAHAWKRHFRPIVVGSALVVRPSWIRLTRRKGQRVVVLDPGLSFGTGQHPTTRFCLEQLVACRPSGDQISLLDIGTGSGILAIAAAKLGYSAVKALDLDPEAIAIARANARRNGVERKIEFCRTDVARLPLRPSERYSLICANLLTPLLISQRHRILGQLQARGRLVVAGILATEFRDVQAAFEQIGMAMAKKRTEGEWCSGTFSN